MPERDEFGQVLGSELLKGLGRTSKFLGPALEKLILHWPPETSSFPTHRKLGQDLLEVLTVTYPRYKKKGGMEEFGVQSPFAHRKRGQS
jgi:hypothetical protein